MLLIARTNSLVDAPDPALDPALDRACAGRRLLTAPLRRRDALQPMPDDPHPMPDPNRPDAQQPTVAKSRGTAWLLDARGRRFRRHPEAISFIVMHQAHEGALWRKLTLPDGSPLRLPLTITRAEFIAMLGDTPGSYQLNPLNQHGQQRGDPPQRIDLHNTVAIASPAADCSR
ncbi:MAG: hypothetical protein IPL61_09370 [Myxococcales bacterium]|nr:hypothetical protein [Myxococcales bacterium]